MTSNGGPVYVTVRARTDLGRTRDHNEDAFLVADLSTGATELSHADAHTVSRRGSLFLVADGMGGAAAGELASSMAVELIFSHLMERWAGAKDGGPDEFIKELRTAVEQANDRIHAYSKDHPDVRGMGTTATVAGVLGRTLYLAQVGDSRGYLIRGGVATQLTKDQSLMQRLVDAGELTQEEAEASERRNIILQALGPEARIRVDLTWQDLQRGDTLVICSDGLSGQVKREEIATLAAEHPDLDELCDRLIHLANERGGPDNITVVTARFDGEGLPEADHTEHVGYHHFPSGDDDTDEMPVPQVAAPALAPALAPTVEHPSMPRLPRRTGSPAALAVVTGVILLLLGLLYFLITR